MVVTHIEAEGGRKACKASGPILHALMQMHGIAMNSVALACMCEVFQQVKEGVHVAKVYNETHLKSMIDEGLEIDYNTTGTVISPVNVFDSDFHFFAAAASVQIISILVVLFTFYGTQQIR